MFFLVTVEPRKLEDGFIRTSSARSLIPYRKSMRVMMLASTVMEFRVLGFRVQG